MARKKQNNYTIFNEQVMESIQAMCASQIAVKIRCAPGRVIVNNSDGIGNNDHPDVFLMAGNKTGCFSGRQAKNGRDFIQLFFFFKDGNEVIEWLRSIKQDELRAHYLYRFFFPAQYSAALEAEIKKAMADPAKTSWKQEDGWGKYLEIPYGPDDLGFVIGWSIPELPAFRLRFAVNSLSFLRDRPSRIGSVWQSSVCRMTINPWRPQAGWRFPKWK